MTLLEFGYHRENIVYALRVTNNNVELACSFLLTNPHPAYEPPSQRRPREIVAQDYGIRGPRRTTLAFQRHPLSQQPSQAMP
jgi:UBA/TS-N domain